MFSGIRRPVASTSTILLHLLPVALPVLLLVGGGLSVAVVQAVGGLSPVPTSYRGVEAFSFLLSRQWFRRSFAYTAYVAFASASVSVILGMLLARAIWRVPGLHVATVYKLPLIMPHIGVAFIVVLFASDSGLIAAALHQIGIANFATQSLGLLYAGNGVGLILAYVYKETPFAALLILGVLHRIDGRLVTTAHNLGAGRSYTFRRVILPHILPVANTTFIILFLYSFGAFDIPFLLSESRPQMLSIFVYDTYFMRDLAMRPLANAALLMMFAVAIVFIILYSRAAVKLQDRSRKL